jgi:hypothetical protein
MSEEIVENVSWNPMLEDYFKKIGEQSQAFAWMYNHAEEIYARRRTWIDIPSNVLASVTGFLSVGSTTIFEGETKLASIALGVASLLVSIMNMTKSYFSWSQKAEGCKISSYHYGKLYRLIEVQMGLPQGERIRCGDFLKMVRDAFEDLNKTSYPLPPESLDAFRKKFGGDKYNNISKPTIVNGLESVLIFKERVTLTLPSPSPASPQPA